MRLQERDLHDVLQIARTALAANHVDELRGLTLRMMHKLFQAERGNFGLWGQSSLDINFDNIVGHGIEAKYFSVYRQYYHRLNPFFCYYASTRRPVFTHDQALPGRDLLRCEFYNEFLKPQSIRYGMIVSLRSGPRMLGAMALYRPATATDFSDRDLAKAELLAPYLVAALEKALLADRITEQEQSLSAGEVNLLDQAVMVLDESLWPVFRSAEANRILSQYFPETETGTGGVPEVPTAVRRCCDELRRAASAGEDRPWTCRRLETAAPGQTLWVRLRLIHDQDHSPRYLIYLEKEGAHDVFSGYLESRCLTRREMEVANLVCQGLTNRAVAEQLCLSVYTVEEYLKTIYQKCGVKNRTSLAHLKVSLTRPRTFPTC